MYVHIFMNGCVYIFMYVSCNVCLFMNVCTSVCRYEYKSMYECVSTFMHVPVYVYFCIMNMYVCYLYYVHVRMYVSVYVTCNMY